MWIKRSEYDSLKEESTRLWKQASAFESLLSSIRSMNAEGKKQIMLSDKCCLMSQETYREICEKLVSNESEIRTLTAERDWYKNAYAQQRCTLRHGRWIPVDEKEDAFDCSECDAMVQKRFLYCPKCGAIMDL